MTEPPIRERPRPVPETRTTESTARGSRRGGAAAEAGADPRAGGRTPITARLSDGSIFSREELDVFADLV